jgi:pimeloyl-ACP methyl ester carboxylesterase
MNYAKEIAGAVQKYWGIVKVPHDQSTREFLAGCESASVRQNNHDYLYYSRGSGRSIVLVHGLHSNLGSMVPLATDLLELGYRVVLFDAPAHGETPGSRTTQLEVRDLIRKIGAQLGDIHAVVCHSLGGLWALNAWGEQFHAKTLVSVASPASMRFLVEKFVQLGQLPDVIAKGLYKELEIRFGDNVWTEFSPSEIVRRVAVPGFIIHSRNDNFVPPTHAAQLAENWAKAKVEMVDGEGHFDIVGSLKVRKLITIFLQEFQ